jgi:hypothetical protein
MLEKVPNDPCAKIFEAEFGRSLPESTADVSTQKLERVAVTGDGVLADALLGCEVSGGKRRSPGARAAS